MALWGTKDDKTSTGTVAITTGGAVTVTATLFDTEAKVGDFLNVTDDGQTLLITAIASNTSCTVIAENGSAITTVDASNNYTLQECPTFVATSEVGGDPAAVFGVDTDEVGATAGVPHAGWVRRTALSGNKSGRVQHEVLVASSSITNDADDDTQYPDAQ